LSAPSRPPRFLWAFLKPRLAADWTSDDDHPRDRQFCLQTQFLLLRRGGISTGCWSIEFTDHCLARLVSDSRSPLALGAVETMFAGYRALLDASAMAVLTHAADFLLPATDGVFRCSAAAGPPLVDVGRQLFVRADSWLHAEMLYADQRPVPAADDPADRLGDRLLLPMPLRVEAAKAA
jgi:hypothetical protein